MSRPKFEILAYEHTPLGVLCLRRRELLARPGTIVTEVTLDHEFLMSSYVTDSERALARIALEMCGRSELDLLVGGLGLGYTAHEVLASERVRRVEVVEYLPQVIAWLDERLIPLAAELSRDARLAVRAGDVYADLLAPPSERYDAIVIDVDHSPDEPLGSTSAAFYTEDGLRRAARHLRAGGVLGVWSYAESSAFVDAMRAVFGTVRVEPITVWNPVASEEQTDWLVFARAGDDAIAAAG